MLKEQNAFNFIIVELSSILFASLISFPISEYLELKVVHLPWLIVAVFVLIILFYYLCVSMVKSSFTLVYSRYKKILDLKPIICKCKSKKVYDIMGKSDIKKERLDLLSLEIHNEKQQLKLIKDKEDDVKLKKILKYTSDTFLNLGFEEYEVYKICECVKCFVTNPQVLKTIDVHINRTSVVTQISLKNFAWNIAYKYHIKNIDTAEFVKVTFSEWFINTSVETIRKTLRTTIGRHEIEIDENITR